MREKVQSILDSTNNTIIFDPCSIKWGSFKWTNGWYKHYVSSIEIEKPYLISYKYYGIVDYWDIILLLNNVKDIFEVVPESIFYIPKLDDLKTFILENKK